MGKRRDATGRVGPSSGTPEAQAQRPTRYDALFAAVENAKRALLAAGLGDTVPDGWLLLVGVCEFDRRAGLPPRARQLSATETGIVELLQEAGPMTGAVVARRLKLNYDYCRSLLAWLRREGRLDNNENGYLVRVKCEVTLTSHCPH